MNERRAIGVVSTTAGILGLILALVPFNRAWATEFCGETFHGPGTFTLDSDVGPCSGPNFAIELTNGATLNMAGHTVSCDGNSLSIGVFILGDGSSVSNGTVTNCETGFGSLADKGKLTKDIADGNEVGFSISNDNNKLKKNQATGNFNGFEISGDSNTLNGNLAANNRGNGFDISGSNNHLLKKNKADQNGGDGFDIEGDSNTLTENTSTNHTAFGLAAGFSIEGNANTLQFNTAKSNLEGFFVKNDVNTLSHNTASSNFDNGIVIEEGFIGNIVSHSNAKGNVNTDLLDLNEECTSNTWKRNKFVTKIPACIR